MLHSSKENSILTHPVIPFKLKKFISASSSSSPFNNDRPCENYVVTNTENGESVSNYYLRTTSHQDEEAAESVSDSEDIFICEEVTHAKNKNKQSRVANQYLVNQAMKFAQHNDLENLQRMVDLGISVNSTDEYGWSLLMVAACAGSENIVKYLLDKNARRGRRDSIGNTALFLACKNKHTKIVDLLMKNKNENQSENNNDLVASASSYFCEICNITTNCSRIEHNTSIAHLLKEGPVNAKPFYGIPRNNIGFQMLLQQGWDDGDGLGPAGTGRKYPIKTKQKKDRAGIGKKPQNVCNNSDGVARIEKLRLLSLKSTRKILKKEKLKERELRRIFNEPDL